MVCLEKRTEEVEHISVMSMDVRIKVLDEVNTNTPNKTWTVGMAR
jgi:hypothetical protein